ncbi:MAG: hypothetical protein ACRD22_16390, partial [Terriglobia bacterium]
AVGLMGQSSGTPQETDLTNNNIDAGIVTITPSDSADLAITAASFPSSVAAGSTFDMKPTVVRTGQMEGFDYWTDAILSPDGNLHNNANIFAIVYR